MQTACNGQFQAVVGSVELESGMKATIEIESLSKIYRRGKSDEVTAVSRLDLKVGAGQVFGFLGSNGAGKTTTIKMACGLVLPTTGTVRLNGYDVRRERGRAMPQIGAVLEGTRNVYWRMNAWQNLLYFGRIKGVSSGKLLKARGGNVVTGAGPVGAAQGPGGGIQQGHAAESSHRRGADHGPADRAAGRADPGPGCAGRAHCAQMDRPIGQGAGQDGCADDTSVGHGRGSLRPGGDL